MAYNDGHDYRLGKNTNMNVYCPNTTPASRNQYDPRKSPRPSGIALRRVPGSAAPHSPGHMGPAQPARRTEQFASMPEAGVRVKNGGPPAAILIMASGGAAGPAFYGPSAIHAASRRQAVPHRDGNFDYAVRLRVSGWCRCSRVSVGVRVGVRVASRDGLWNTYPHSYTPPLHVHPYSASLHARDLITSPLPRLEVVKRPRRQRQQRQQECRSQQIARPDIR